MSQEITFTTNTESVLHAVLKDALTPEELDVLYAKYKTKRFGDGTPQQFPRDDENNMMQGDLGGSTGDLSIFYTAQFVQNEPHSGDHFFLKHTPVLAGTLTGVVYIDDKAAYTIVVSEDGKAKIKAIKGSNSSSTLRNVSLNCATGEVNLEWYRCQMTNLVANEYTYGKVDYPKNSSVKLSYEYDCK